MDNLKIETHHNVIANYQLAGLWQRILAFLIDAVVITGYVIAARKLLYETGTLGTVTAILFLGIPTYIYWLVLEIIMDGQTLGKRVMKIKVSKTDGSAPGFTDYFLRWLLIPIDYALGGSVALVSIIFTKKGQRLGDMLAGTTVVFAKKKDAKSLRENLIYNSTSQDYEPSFAQARSLTSAEINLIKRALDAYEKSYNRRPIMELQERLEKKLDIKSNQTPKKFLTTLMQDYMYYSSVEE